MRYTKKFFKGNMTNANALASNATAKVIIASNIAIGPPMVISPALAPINKIRI